MSLTISTDVFCDYCPDWTEGATGPRPQARKARQVAKAYGWVYRSGKDICPDCLRHLDDELLEVSE